MLKRYSHYWWALKGAKYPATIAVLDIDSAPTQSTSANGVYTEQLARWALQWTQTQRGTPLATRAERGDSILSLWSAISQLLFSNNTTWLFATPASRILPLIDFWRRLERREITLTGRDWRTSDVGGGHTTADVESLCILEDPPTLILCQLPGRQGKLLILDIRNWGIDPLDGGLDCGARAELYMGCICACLSALRHNRQGSLRCTAASQAVSALRSAYAVTRLHCHTSASALALERAAYYGGRCEAYRIGELKGPIYHVDVRNMYPSLCLTLPVPVSLRRYHESANAARNCGESTPLSCAAAIRVRTTQPRYPLRREGDVVYPVGEFNTYLCGADLAAAVESDSITRWYACAEYTCATVLAPFYGDWLSMLASARAAGSGMVAQWIKRVMNALPGKFGEPGREWIAAPSRPEHGDYATWWEPDEDGQPVRWRNIAGHTQLEQTSSESYHSIPAIAGWITAAGRSRLWDYHTAAGRDAVWYADTDSLLCNRDGFYRLLCVGAIRDGETGYLRLIGRHSTGFIHGIRHYQLSDTVTCAGVPRGEIQPGETREQYFLRRRIADEIALGRAPRGEREQLTYPTAVEYRHGNVQPDGTVTPLEVYYG